jgi:hypothetical protein
MRVRCLGVLILCVAVLLGTVACGGGGVAPNGMTGADIMARYQNASASIETVQSDASMIESALGQEITMNMSMTADKPNRKMYMSQTYFIFMSTVEVEVYMMDNWIYVPSGTVKGKWVKTPLTEDVWNEEYNRNLSLEFFNNSADANYIGMETVGGIDCYKVSIKPDFEVLLGVLNMSEFDDISLSDMLKSYSCVIWIDENTYCPVKMSIDMQMEVEGVPMSVRGMGTYSNINQPITITLPVAAINATEISYEDFMAGEW